MPPVRVIGVNDVRYRKLLLGASSELAVVTSATTRGLLGLAVLKSATRIGPTNPSDPLSNAPSELMTSGVRPTEKSLPSVALFGSKLPVVASAVAVVRSTW